MEKALREVAKMTALDYARSTIGERYEDEKGEDEGHGVDGPHRFKLMDTLVGKDAIQLLSLPASERMSQYLDGWLRKLEVGPFSKEWSETHAYAQKVYFSEVAKNARKKLGTNLGKISYK